MQELAAVRFRTPADFGYRPALTPPSLHQVTRMELTIPALIHLKSLRIPIFPPKQTEPSRRVTCSPRTYQSGLAWTLNKQWHMAATAYLGVQLTDTCPNRACNSTPDTSPSVACSIPNDIGIPSHIRMGLQVRRLEVY